MTKKINALVWNEFLHEKKDEAVIAHYPDGIHTHIAKVLEAGGDITAATATMDQPEHGLTAAILENTDVLLWWGHVGHDQVNDAIVERVAERVWAGMGLIVLHSAHFAKIFKRLMGTPCGLSWREAGERERVITVNPRHPITAGIGEYIELEHSEMYGEPFGIPEPLETVFISWYQGGDVFRSGVTYRRGAGNIFYFSPGHETYPIYHDANIGTVLKNAVRWAHNPLPRVTDVTDAPNAPEPREPLGGQD